MFLSRIEPRPQAASTPAFWERLQAGAGSHELVWSWFADSAERTRDFLFRHEGAGLGSRYMTLSEREPHDPLGLFRIESKRFAPDLAPGDRLRFSVRVNPTVKKERADGKGARHDVVMDAKHRAGSRDALPPEAELVEREGLAWLARRAEAHGFEFRPGEVRVEGYRQLRFPRGKGKPDARLSTLDFEGLLTVRDPERFGEMLCGGLGPAKAFGCGLVLVRRA